MLLLLLLVEVMEEEVSELSLVPRLDFFLLLHMACDPLQSIELRDRASQIESPSELLLRVSFARGGGRETKLDLHVIGLRGECSREGA